MRDEVLEHQRIARLIAGLPRQPLQINRAGESDAELIRLPCTDTLLAVTMDSIIEEVEWGLYEDPYLLGWMGVTVSASDLAAVGADPIGILLSQTFPDSLDCSFEQQMQRGVRAACASCDLFLLGGDTNHSDRLQITSTAIGTVPAGEAMLRTGGIPGDLLYSSGPLGLGNVFALEVLMGRTCDESLRYRPSARLVEARRLRHCATCCMDTSDGTVATLDELMRLGGFGVQLTTSVADLLHPDVLRRIRRYGLPDWVPLAGPHGEFELILMVRPPDAPCFEKTCREVGLQPRRIGIASDKHGLRLSAADGGLRLDSTGIRNLRLGSADLDGYLTSLLELATDDATARPEPSPAT